MSRTERLAPAVVLLVYVAGLVLFLEPRATISDADSPSFFYPIVWGLVLVTIGTVCLGLAALSVVRRITQPVTVAASIWVVASGWFSFTDDVPILAWAALAGIVLVGLVIVRRRRVMSVPTR